MEIFPTPLGSFLFHALTKIVTVTVSFVYQNITENCTLKHSDTMNYTVHRVLFD